MSTPTKVDWIPTATGRPAVTRRRTSRAFRHAARVMLLAIFLSIALPAQPAAAATTPTVCDTSGPAKYWCFWADYTQNVSYVTVNNTRMTGGLGCSPLGGCGATQWQLFISSLWRQDPSSGTWFWLLDYGPLGWRSDNPIWTYSYGANPGYFVSANADIQMKARFVPYPSGSALWCGDVIDFYLPPGGETWIRSGQGAPCEQN